ncbi:uncharacterized protein TRAVEDRAFT_61034 [Trametes versicolor FP-101664 SS1]|uniref:uncharacterized protein n=1 Tax=Trametes versicolor (strain FP-101664) TaxID=717944 RepID=UPI0004621DD7|nr:uncharacterized protein TRAVEDRAFT_61034 [Trametes versicolor FP-101664 SS1]EIW52561.1 hypothetical protein TRAVEDRAFT_61034 [Trametes versicolor FP-101664 SS1]
MTAPYYGLSPFQLTEVTSSTREVVLAARDHLVSQRDTLELQILSANALLNSTSPVNRLPTEILINIFRDLKEGRTESGTQPWYNVAAVCRSWRAIASSTPLLWNDIHVGPDMNAVLFQAFLERSLPFPIAVSFASSTKLAVYLALIRAHLSRVRVLRFISTPRSEADLVADLLNESMPTLEKLTVWLNPSLNEDGDEDDDMDASQEEEVFAWRPEEQKLPHLVDLSLRGIVLRFSATLGTSLRRLELRDCIGLAASLAVLNDVLRRCDKLEKLLISRYRCNDERLGPGPRISLPQTLRTLVLVDSHWYTAYVLDTFYVPPTVQISITKVVENEQEDRLDGPISECIPEDRTCLPILAMVDRVHVELQRADGVCTVIGAVGAHKITIDTIAMHVEDTVVPDIARDLPMLFGDAPLVELIINCVGEHYITMMDWIHMLKRFPLIQRLSVIGGSLSQSEHQPRYTLVAALQGPRNVLCPNLRELALVSRHPEEDKLLQNLTACLERREARGQRLAVLRFGLICGTAGCLGADEKAELEQREVRRIEVLSHLADKVEFASNAVKLFDNSPYEEIFQMTSAEGGSEMGGVNEH